MEARAREMVCAGITTARDLGGPDGSELALRDRILAGERPGPRLLCAGQPLTSRRGHCWFWGGEAETEEEIGEHVRRQVEAGCDWIKVMATGGLNTPGTSPAAAQYATAQLGKIVARARAYGRPVAAHAHGTEGIRNAANAVCGRLEPDCRWISCSWIAILRGTSRRWPRLSPSTPVDSGSCDEASAWDWKRARACLSSGALPETSGRPIAGCEASREP